MKWEIERLKSALNAAQLGFWDWDLNQQTLSWSPQTERILGYEPETVEHTYESWAKQLHPEDRPRVEAAIQAAVESHQDLRVEYRTILPSGDCRWIEAQGRMIPSDDQQSAHMVGLVRDITARKQSREALQSSESRFRAVFEQAAVGMARLAPDGRWIQVNQVLCNFFGYTADELCQLNFRDVTDPEDINTDEQIYRQLISGEIDSCRFEKRYLHKSGHSVWALVTVSTETDSDGNISCFIAVIENIQEQKRIEQELQERAAELISVNTVLAQTTALLEKRNSELSQFAYVASHDLKAPLRAIANLSEWIEEDLSGQLPADNERQLQLLRSRVHRMEGLIDGLLAYSRVGRRDRPVEQVDLRLLLMEVIDSIAPPASFRIILPSTLPVFATQPTAIRQVFANLLSNAVKHHDREDGCVTVTATELETAYEFTVKDDGPGIDPRYHDKVFAIFQTLKARDEVENTGIGLAIVKKIVETEGGTIQLESSVGKGCTFRFTWPK